MNATQHEMVCFFKMQGCGNDFVLIDNRDLELDPGLMPEWAKKLCRRAFGIGADGLIFLDEAKNRSDVDYVWHFFNADGSRAQMCGNGARCAAKLAAALGFAGPNHRLGTDAGAVEAQVSADTGLVRVELTKPAALEQGIVLDVPGGPVTVSFVNTGVPHAVAFVEDAAGIDVAALGRAVRFHPRFAPAGTNVNFVERVAFGRMILRTYERGVEAETYACGTGAAASALAARALGFAGDDAEIRTSGGETLYVSLDGDRVFLTGAAEMVFTGAFSPANLDLCVGGECACSHH